MSYTSQIPFMKPREGSFYARNSRSRSTSGPPCPTREFVLHQTLSELQRPPSNPHGLPLWALRPRPLDLDALIPLHHGVNDWKFITSDMIDRATSRQFFNHSLLDQHPAQALAPKQQSAAGGKLMEGVGEAEQNTCGESETGGQRESEKQHEDPTGNEQPSDHGTEVEDESREEHFEEYEDEGLQSEEDDKSDVSDDDYVHARDEAEEDQHASTRKEIDSRPSLHLKPSKAPVESHDADLQSADLGRAQSAQQISRMGGKAEGEPMVTHEFDQLLSAIEGGSRAGSHQKAGSRYSRFLNEQERLFAQLQTRNSKRSMPILDNHSINSGLSSSDSTNRASKRVKTAHLESGDDSSEYEQSKPEGYPALSLSERPSCEGSKPRARVPLPASRPYKVPLVPRQSPTKKDKWSDEEHEALIKLMVAQREREMEQNVPPSKWLKDVKLYTKISLQLAERGIIRSANACKNEWNRTARQKSGFEERPNNGTTRAMICSEQKRKTGSRSMIQR